MLLGVVLDDNLGFPGAGCAEEPSELLTVWGLHSLLGLSLTVGLGFFSLHFLA